MHHEALEGGVLDLYPRRHGGPVGVDAVDRGRLRPDLQRVGQVEPDRGLLDQPPVAVLPDAGERRPAIGEQRLQRPRGRTYVVVHQPDPVVAGQVGGLQAAVEAAGAAEILAGVVHDQRQAGVRVQHRSRLRVGGVVDDVDRVDGPGLGGQRIK